MALGLVVHATALSLHQGLGIGEDGVQIAVSIDHLISDGLRWSYHILQTYMCMNVLTIVAYKTLV